MDAGESLARTAARKLAARLPEQAQAPTGYSPPRGLWTASDHCL